MTELIPPLATKHPVQRTIHGETVQDDFTWLQDAEDPMVLDYLQQENRYTNKVLAATTDLQDQIYSEIESRIVQSDISVETPRGDYRYYTRTLEGSAYAIHCRRKGDEGEEQIILDENLLAENEEYLAVGALAVSPNQKILAFTTDTDGSERYLLRFKDLDTGKLLRDGIELVAEDIAWANNETIFYTSPDELMRPWQVWRHRLGTESSHDQIVLEDSDEQFYLSCERSRDGNWVVISADSFVASEVHLVDTAHPERTPLVVAARQRGHEYSVEPCGERIFILSNAGAENFRLMECSIGSLDQKTWSEVRPEDDVRLTELEAFESHLVACARKDGLPAILVMDLATGTWRDLEFDEVAYEIDMANNAEFATDSFAFSYESMVTPPSVFKERFDGSSRELLKRQEVLGEFDPEQYEMLRLWANSTDGAKVPISLVRHKDTPSDGTAPGVVYGYGSYEISTPASFSASRLSLLDRGVVWAMVHSRGGGELGRSWYNNGKLEHKQHTFDDVFAGVEELTSSQLIATNRVALWGRSAGGLLCGAAVTQRPELFASAIADVPFVDVVNTMLDESLPLTATEWDQWGNPAEPEAYARMMAYAPYENVVEQAYPALLVTGGLHDPRVGFWEPAKWVAKMRLHHQGENPILLKIDTGSGHFGSSGRYEAWKKEATSLAFLLWSLKAG